MNAPDKATEIKAGITAGITALTAFWGWLGWAILLMIASMALDYITGSIAARRSNTWDSTIARDGLWHKLGETSALLVAILCDLAISVILNTAAAPLLGNFEYRNYLTLLVAIWYTITELGSITENAGAMGAPIPKWLKKGLAKLHDKADDVDPLGAGKVEDEKTN